MVHPPETWFSSFVGIEVLLQLPFFVLALYALLHASSNNATKESDKHTLIRGDGLFKSLCLIYGSSTATTLIPILSTILSDDDTSAMEKGVLLGFYLPYFIFPVWLVAIAASEENVFGRKAEKGE